MNINEEFGKSFKRFVTASADLSLYLLSKSYMKEVEYEFVDAFDEMAEIMLHPEFQLAMKESEKDV